MTTAVTFSINLKTQDNEIVCVVGSAPKLGFWEPTNAVRLEKSDNVDGFTWSCSVLLAANSSYNYRFFVCKSSTKDLQNLEIVKWETHRVPRNVQTGNGERSFPPVAKFGVIDGVHSVSKGCLINTSEVQIRLRGKLVVQDASNNPWAVSCSSFRYPLSQDASNSRCSSSTEVLVSDLSKEDSLPQRHSGKEMISNNFLVFRYSTHNLSTLGCRLDIYPSRYSDLYGSAYLLPVHYPKSHSHLSLPIINSKGMPCGHIEVDVLVVRPLVKSSDSMEVSNLCYHHWRKCDQKPFDIGHRGMGSSFSKENEHKENTVGSFNAAYTKGAEFIETDIMLTKDDVPVIYHDFCVTTAIRNKAVRSAGEDKNEEIHTMPLQDLILQEIKSKKFFTPKGVAINDEEIPLHPSYEPFPTLQEILISVNPKLGMDLEIKFPQMCITGQMESSMLDHDLNAYVDTILKVVLQFAHNRPIFFSTFHPEIAILLRMKQHNFPVTFLSQGSTQLYDQFEDFRSNTLNSAINFASSENLLGVVLHTEVVLREMQVLDSAIKKQLIVFLWGDHNNNPAVIQDFRQRGVDGLIYDRMDLHKPENAPVVPPSNESNNNSSTTNGSNATRRKASDVEDGGSPTKREKKTV